MGKGHPPKTKTKLIADDYGIEGLIYKQENHGRPINLSKAMTRPAYAYTSAQQKLIFKQSACLSCGYYYKTEEMPKEECIFPWDDPQDYDMAAYDYLPCKGEGIDETD